MDAGRTARSSARPRSTPASRRSRSRARASPRPTTAMFKEVAALGVTVTRLSPAEKDAFVQGHPPGLRQVDAEDRPGPGEARPKRPSPRAQVSARSSAERRPGRADAGAGRSPFRQAHDELVPALSMPPEDRPRIGTGVEEGIAAVAMALVCVITFGNVLVRYFTNASFAFTEEFSVFLLVVLTLAGASAAFARNRAHPHGVLRRQAAAACRIAQSRCSSPRAAWRCSRVHRLVRRRGCSRTTGSTARPRPASACRSGSTRSGCRCSRADRAAHRRAARAPAAGRSLNGVR